MKIFGLILVAILPHSLLAQTPKPTVNDLSFLAGCWEAEDFAENVMRIETSHPAKR